MNGYENIQFSFSPQAKFILEELKYKTEAENYAEVIRKALALYKWFVNTKENGLEIAAIDKDEIKETIIL